MQMKPIIGRGARLALALVLALAVGLAACGGAGAQGAGAASASGEEARPPDFELDSLDGRSVQLSDYLGKDVVLIDFWATYCDPCLAAMPHLDQLYRKYKDKGFVVLGISVDGPDSVAQVKTEVAKLGVTFPILLDQDSRVVALYNPSTHTPFSVLIARNGRVIMKKEGYATGDTTQLDKDVQAAVAAK